MKNKRPRKTLKKAQVPPKKKSPKSIKKIIRNTSKFDLLRLLQSKSYFDLVPDEIKDLKKSFGNQITGYSFVLHPDVIPKININKFDRYIFIIETIRSDIYKGVRAFFNDPINQININTYFIGGTADFICDAYLNESSYNQFRDSLYLVFTEVGSTTILDPEEYIIIYKVNKPLILSGKILSSIPGPSKEIIKEIKNDLVGFELALKNYKSNEAKNHFHGVSKIRKYIERLKVGNALVGYDVLYDLGQGVDKSFVLLCQARDQVKKILEGDIQSVYSSFTLPISELLTVTCLQGDEDADKKVSHISFNDYNLPYDKLVWRNFLYEYEEKGSVNLFYYPLEGTLHESGLTLSDLPEVFERAKQYQNGNIHLGEISHSLLNSNAPKVGLLKESLSFHGLTLGAPGSGKTTTDIVLALEVVELVESVIILDHSKSIRKKRTFLNKYDIDETFIELPKNSDVNVIKGKLREAMGKKGLHVLECDPSDYPLIFKTIIAFISDSDDAVPSGVPRVIKYFLLLEEAHEAFENGIGKNASVEQFINCLTKAWRKGWCIWASTQTHLLLGYDDSSRAKIMEFLHNKIIHHITQGLDILLESLQVINPVDKKYIKQNLEKPLQHSVLVLGSKIKNENLCDPLRPLMVKINQPQIILKSS